MALSKKLTAQIQSAIDQLDRGIAYIKSDDTVIGRRTKSDNSTVWRDERGIRHYSVCKDIGSDLCYLYNARQSLKQLITPVIM